MSNFRQLDELLAAGRDYASIRSRPIFDEKKFLEKFGKDACVDFMKLIGNEFKHNLAIERASLIPLVHGQNTPDNERARHITALSEITRQMAARMLFQLPDVVIGHAPSDISGRELGILQHQNSGVAVWLLHWDRSGGNTPRLPIIKACYSELEPIARASELQFQLIRRMIECGEIAFLQSFTKPGLPWLLCQVSEARRNLTNLDFTDHMSKRKAYQGTKKYLEQLSSAFNPPDSTEASEFFSSTAYESLDEKLRDFDLIVELTARNLAATNTIFDRQYWQPYTKALTAVNIHIKSDKRFQIVNQTDKPFRQRQQRKPKG